MEAALITLTTTVEMINHRGKGKSNHAFGSSRSCGGSDGNGRSHIFQAHFQMST